MKKIGFFIAGALAVGTMMTSCETVVNSAEPSGVTYLPKLTMHGDAYIELPCNATSYVDEGLTALEGGTEIQVNTEITGSYFSSSTVNGPDVYSIVYSASNKDGIPGAAERTVVWGVCPGDFTTSIAGMYKADVKRNGSITPQYQNLGPIMIVDKGNGVFAISDAIGGYYDFGRKYGYHYAARGFTVKAVDIPGNKFEYAGQTIEVGDFGGALVMTDFKIDPAAKTIKFTTDWDAGFLFEVTLTQL